MKPPSAQSDPNFIVSHNSSIRARLAATSIPASTRSSASTPRTEPIRQGVHLPQLSAAQNCMANRAIRAMSTLSSNTTIPGMADQPVGGGEGLIVEGQVEFRGREIGAQWPTHLHRPDRPAGEGAAANVVDQFAERDPEGGLEQTAIPDIAGELDRHRPARAAHAVIRIGLRALRPAHKARRRGSARC